MEIKKVIENINFTIQEINNYKTKYNRPEDSFAGFLKVLEGIKIELLESSTVRNARLIRGFKDICADVAKNYEGQPFDAPMFEIAEYFSKTIPDYRSLELLRMDFGKGDPI